MESAAFWYGVGISGVLAGLVDGKTMAVAGVLALIYAHNKVPLVNISPRDELSESISQARARGMPFSVPTPTGALVI